MPRFARSPRPYLVIAAALLAPAIVSAQASTTRGFSIGVHALGTSLTTDNSDPRNGGGASLRLGYGFNRIVTGFVHIDGSEIEIPSGQAPGTGITGAWGMGHAEIGARFHFANSLRRWVPYLETSAGARAVSVGDAKVNGQNAGEVTFNGGAFTVGAGLSTFFRRTTAFDVSLKWTDGKFTEVDLGSVALRNLDIEASSFRLGIGIIWWPR